MRVLAIDIETSPNLAHVWALFNQNVSLSQLRQTGEVICFAAKWYGKPKVFFHSTFHDGKQEMLDAAHALLTEADVVMGWNSKSFDMKHLMREFLEAGMPPPAPSEQIDLCNVVKKQFRFVSNKLQHVSTQLGLEGKVQHTGHDLWVRCMAGDEKAWALMRRYNKRDVTVLEELYDRLQPWIPGHPNRALADGVDAGCPACASTDLQRRGVQRTRQSVYQRYQCQGCGKWLRSVRRSDGVDVTEVAA